MLNITIVEDNLNDSKVLQQFIKKYFENNGEEYKLTVFDDGINFISDYNEKSNIVFMDIEMPLLDGIKTARKLRAKDSYVSIIFVTNMAKYAINGYEVNALDFMVKPIDYFNFTLKMDKAVKLQKKYMEDEKGFVITCDEGIVKLIVNDVYFIESSGHYVIYHTRKGNFKTRDSMKECEKRFSNCDFARCNNAFIINLQKIESSNGDVVKVADQEIPISRGKKKEFMNALTSYYCKGGI